MFAFSIFAGMTFFLANKNDQFCIFSSIAALPYGDDNNDIYSNDDYEDTEPSGGQREKQIYSVPQFVSESQSDLVNEGSTIRLNCLVDRLGKNK